MNPNVFTNTTASELGYDLAGGIINLNVYNSSLLVTPFMIKIG